MRNPDASPGKFEELSNNCAELWGGFNIGGSDAGQRCDVVGDLHTGVDEAGKGANCLTATGFDGPNFNDVVVFGLQSGRFQVYDDKGGVEK